MPTQAGPVAAELTIVVPCYNERANVGILAERLATALGGTSWEAVFVDDDSPDGTAAEVRRLAASDPRLRCIRRVGRRGLASAVIEGVLSSSAPLVAVMDGDLQHDATPLLEMRQLLRTGACDLVIASRYSAGGSAEGLDGGWRHGLSEAGTRLARALLAVRLTDPMSGFFMVRREIFERNARRLTGQGFKILLDLLLSDRQLRVREIGSVFHERVAGQSKLDALVLVQFGGLLLDKALGGMVPLRFVGFALVGAIGVLINVAALLVLSRVAALDFATAQTLATMLAMVANFQLNNRITYRDQTLRGRRFAGGLLLFMLACGIGAVANVGIARLMYSSHVSGTWAGAAGALLGVVWNYAMSATLVWRQR